MPVAYSPSKTTELTPEQIAQAQQDFVAALPRIEEHAKVKFGWIRDPGKRDDSIATAIGLGWKHWLAAVAQGKDPKEFVSAIADFSVRATRSGRRVDRMERPKDVLSPRAQARHGFTVQRLDTSVAKSHDTLHADPHGQDKADFIEQALADNTVTPPPDQAAFRVDVPEWLSKLTAKKRGIVEGLMQGDTTKEAAAKHGTSEGRIRQIRREAYEDLREYVGEGPGR